MRRTLVAVRLALAVAVLAPWATAPAASAAPQSPAAAKAAEGKFKSDTFTGLAFRSLGPALTSGRVIDFALHPSAPDTWYVAVACGNLWKTTNAGTTWKPIFDDQGSYSIGCVAIDPKNPLIVWLGTGENNSQRSVGYGDGLYKSLDGGATWKKVGLENSEHIGEIVIDPDDADVVYVAAQGPLWSSGGDRGLYKTTDGGATWTRVLHVDEWTGVSDLEMDPRDHDVIYATTYQRARRVWTLVDGGPGSGIHKSTDGGKTWTKIVKGLPEGDLGRIGIALSPEDPDVVYALVEASRRTGGFYRSTDGGSHWERRSDYNSTSPQYYQEIVPDPNVEGRIYSLDTWMHVTEDGGKNWHRIPNEQFKHVDNHSLWIDPKNSDHLIAGCDGGLYETFDRCASWKFFQNLPITQFYKIEVDNAEPFYNVYGGTQDNNTIGGPVRTRTDHGITNQDWFITVGGDGFQARVDPTDPNIVYTQWQHGELWRFDRRTGEAVGLQPQPEPSDPPLKWNWDSPLIISPHSHTRLYFAAQRLFRSDDRGDSWTPVSGDLTRQLDRNRMKIMDRVWSADAVAKNASTSFYGNIVSLSESPVKEGLLYVGTDDGLVQASEDGGGHWRRIERFPGVPELSYVSRLEASRHAEGTVYAAFDNHKMGDFKPYVLKSTDRGRSWTSIAGDLPARGTVYALAEDHVDPDLLFAGTEFGVFFTRDGGRRWVQLKGGIPTTCVKDLAIQRRENDLVVGTFGRGFYVLDDYSPLRRASAALLDSAAALLPVKPALAFVPSSPLGGREKASQGDAFYVAPNPPFGAVFTYYLEEDLLTREKARQKREREVAKKGGDVFYPSWDSLRAEAREEEPAVILTVTDEDGGVVRRVTGPLKAGFQRVAWDLRFPPAHPVSLRPPERSPWENPPAGPFVAPGTYRVSLAKRVGGVVTPLAGPVEFQVTPLGGSTLPPRDRGALLAFQRQTGRLQRAVLGAVRIGREAQDRLAHLKKAVDETPGAASTLGERVRALETRLHEVMVELTGDAVLRSRNEASPPSLTDRVDRVVDGHWFTTGDPTRTHRRQYEIAAEAFERLLPRLRGMVDDELRGLESEAERSGAPWTPGRVPEWRRE
jgi:photosystem II stability/assembly factor-like uncharacterized protein